jgi:hypothetical protein
MLWQPMRSVLGCAAARPDALRAGAERLAAAVEAARRPSAEPRNLAGLLTRPPETGL